jgi:hypothetical protein
VLGRLGDEREVRVERLGDVVDERAQEGLADDSGRAGGDGAQEVASPGGGSGVGGGWFEESGQDGRRRDGGSREACDGSRAPRPVRYG